MFKNLFRITTVLLAILARGHPYSVPVTLGRRYLNVTHCHEKKDAVLKRLIASESQALLSVLKRSTRLKY